MAWSYEKAGVDRDRIKGAHSTIADLIQRTYDLRKGKFGEVLAGFGHYASLIDIGGDRALALHSDGCGTKVIVAQLMNKFNTIGIDCVAMCVNDLLCIGAEPTTIIDYLALERPDKTMISGIMAGLVEAAEKTRTTVIGGETAIMPDVIKGAVPGRGFDLAAFCVGSVRKDRVVWGDRLEPGDIILGLASSGIHSNGFSLARKVLLDRAKLDLKRRPKELPRSLGHELLEPTCIYLDAVIHAIENADVHAVAHITGGAFTKLKRFEPYSKVGFYLDEMPDPQPIFRLIQKLGQIKDREMYRTFNMGIGLCIMTPRRHVKQVVESCEASGFKTYDIGSVTAKSGVSLKLKGRTISL